METKRNDRVDSDEDNLSKDNVDSDSEYSPYEEEKVMPTIEGKILTNNLKIKLIFSNK